MHSIDVFWSFRSPYSYLATKRLVELHARYALGVQVRPVLPIALRTPEFFRRVNPLFPSYLGRDAGVPTFVFEGEPFFGQDRIDLLLWRLTRAGLAERDWRLARRVAGGRR